jgi:hypothetical protein
MLEVEIWFKYGWFFGVPIANRKKEIILLISLLVKLKASGQQVQWTQ